MSRIRVAVTVDGIRRHVDVEPDRALVDVLRDDCGVTGIEHGCTDGTCGACTVLVDEVEIRSCLMLGVQAEGAQVRRLQDRRCSADPR
ncbi:2Fe-2S iron-sulfur cluster-binding protein [Actinoplanes sp. DH11]|uniref:2Fe-2S iron-sulfur cluster-binding protein n=1 Tax=Actinoplanes sp. DH11 TaxID=2857011 RepID=UPI001E5E8088|nr:2Fe-2S iron-sulfur cluster-binding protein [Actinoplanes sp. DH11]